MLSVLDSQGNLGEIPPNLFSVTNGNTACLPTPPNSNLILTTNVTGTLQTCQPWGLTIAGGTPPYTVSLASLGSVTVTNATLSPDENLFTYINRANPNGQLLAAVSDAAGNWAAGTALVKTQGSSDITCDGLQSSSGVTTTDASDSSTSQSSSSSPSTTATTAGTTTSQVPSSSDDASSSNNHSTVIIIAACTAVGVFCIVTALLCICIKRKRKKAITEVEPFPTTETRLLTREPGYLRQMPSVTTITTSADTWWHRTAAPPPVPPPSIGSWVAGSSNAGSSPVETSIISPITQSTSIYTDRTTSKTTESQNIFRSGSGSGSGGSMRRNLSRRREKGPPLEAMEMTRVGSEENGAEYSGTMVIQHRDAGSSGPRPGMVEELPPPYADRTR